MVIVPVPRLVEGEDQATDDVRRAAAALDGWWWLDQHAGEEPGNEEKQHGERRQAGKPWWETRDFGMMRRGASWHWGHG